MTRSGALSRWQTMAGTAIERWDRLTTEDLDTVRGNAERLIELLQVRYGFGRQDALAELADWRRTLAATRAN